MLGFETVGDDDSARSSQRSGVFKILSDVAADVGFAIDDVVQDLYEFSPVVPEGRARFEALFAEGARIFGPSWDQGEVGERDGVDVQTFISRRQARGAREERELSRRTESYGDIAQVLSTFERTAQGGLERGLNSVHLRHDGTRWWIVSLVWTVEDPERPLPSRYLRRR